MTFHRRFPSSPLSEFPGNHNLASAVLRLLSKSGRGHIIDKYSRLKIEKAAFSLCEADSMHSA